MGSADVGSPNMPAGSVSIKTLFLLLDNTEEVSSSGCISLSYDNIQALEFRQGGIRRVKGGLTVTK